MSSLQLTQCLCSFAANLRKQMWRKWTAWCLLCLRTRPTYDLGSCNGGAPFPWKMPSMKTPFFPLHFMKKFGWSNVISRWTREMKLECPIFISTSPLLLFRPIVMRVLCISNLKSLPSRRAIALPLGSGAHWILEGLAGAELRDNSAQTSFSDGCWIDITRSTAHQNGSWSKTFTSCLAVYIKGLPTMHLAFPVYSISVNCRIRIFWDIFKRNIWDIGQTIIQHLHFTLFYIKMEDKIKIKSIWFNKIFYMKKTIHFR